MSTIYGRVYPPQFTNITKLDFPFSSLRLIKCRPTVSTIETSKKKATNE